MLGIRFSKDMQGVPPDVLEKVRVMVVRVGRTLASLPPGSLDSSRDERFSFTIGTWRFEYRMDLQENCLIVELVGPARMASTG